MTLGLSNRTAKGRAAKGSTAPPPARPFVGRRSSSPAHDRAASPSASTSSSRSSLARAGDYVLAAISSLPSVFSRSPTDTPTGDDDDEPFTPLPETMGQYLPSVPAEDSADEAHLPPLPDGLPFTKEVRFTPQQELNLESGTIEEEWIRKNRPNLIRHRHGHWVYWVREQDLVTNQVRARIVLTVLTKRLAQATTHERSLFDDLIKGIILLITDGNENCGTNAAWLFGKGQSPRSVCRLSLNQAPTDYL